MSQKYIFCLFLKVLYKFFLSSCLANIIKRNEYWFINPYPFFLHFLLKGNILIRTLIFSFNFGKVNISFLGSFCSCASISINQTTVYDKKDVP